MSVNSETARLGLAEPNVIVTVEVNGTAVTEQVPARLNVADFLRHWIGLTGTHVGCEQGVCWPPSWTGAGYRRWNPSPPTGR
jgi:hypothetical protein